MNTYLFPKLWFTAQFCKLDSNIIKKILSKSLAFIYAGENEKPVNSVNFRSTSSGGIGLINPLVKARALLLKNMYRELLSVGGSIYDFDIIENLYGYKDDFIDIIQNGLSTSPAKAIYDFLIKEVTHRNGSLIPSRNEKKSVNMKWGVVFINFKLVKDLNADEKCFLWKITQDMLPVGIRIHRRNAERRCLRLLENDTLCQEIQTLEHAFRSCDLIVEAYNIVVQVLNRFLERPVSFDELIHFSFNHRNKQKLKCGLWFATKMMFKVFHLKCLNKAQLLKDCVKEIDWNLNMSRKIGSVNEMLCLRQIMTEV